MDYGFPSDSDESAAIEELLSQANDLAVLEQISAINCSGITDSLLPPDLENRFRRLKTFPSSAKPPAHSPPPFVVRPRSASDSSRTQSGGSVRAPESLSDEENAAFSASKQQSQGSKGSRPRSGGGSVSLRSDSSNSSRGIGNPSPPPMGKSDPQKKDRDPKSKSIEDAIFSPLEEILTPKRNPKPKTKPRPPLSPPSNSSSASSRPSSPSPPRKPGCLWCSPKRVSRKKSKENRIVGNGEFLSDLGSFSAREQKKLLKKVAEEEEKINREAEKIVKWAKQASARMHISDDELSD